MVASDEHSTKVEPCFACKATGAAAMSCVGIAALHEAHRLRRMTGPPQRRWATFLVLLGTSSLGAALARLYW